MKSKKKRPEFSKRILVCVAIGTVAVAVFSCIMIWRTQDLTPLAYLIPAIFAELAVGTAFYYNKSKAENEIKLKKLYGENPDSPSEEETE